MRQEAKAFRYFINGGWGSPRIAAAYLNRSVAWLKAEVQAGRLPCIKTKSGRLLFRRGDLDTALSKGSAKGGAADGR